MLEDSLPRSDDHFAGLRALAFHLDASESTLLAFAQALTVWHKRHGYCGQCGTPTIIAQGGHVRVCSAESCGTTHYPRTDPAIIVLVESDDHALFGRKPEWPKHRYSTIAGFVEPGESAEQAVVREVAEETNITVLSAHYHSSQPWPIPGSLMLGYHAKEWVREVDLDRLVGCYGNVPGALLNTLFVSLQPFRLGSKKYIDLIDLADNPARLKTFARMEQWIADSPDQAGTAFP